MLQNLTAKRFLSLAFLLVSSTASAETQPLVNCNGRWTNLPCPTSKVEGKIEASSARKVLSPGEAKLRSDKQSVLHRLTMRNIEAREKLGADIDISSADEICLYKSSTLDECRAEVERLGERLDRSISARALLLQEEKGKQEKERSQDQQPQSSGSQTTIIVTDPYLRWGRRYRRPPRQPTVPPTPFNPNYRDDRGNNIQNLKAGLPP